MSGGPGDSQACAHQAPRVEKSLNVDDGTQGRHIYSIEESRFPVPAVLAYVSGWAPVSARNPIGVAENLGLETVARAQLVQEPLGDELAHDPLDMLA